MQIFLKTELCNLNNVKKNCIILLRMHKINKCVYYQSDLQKNKKTNIDVTFFSFLSSVSRKAHPEWSSK